MNASALLAVAVRRLSAAGIVGAGADARRLLAHAMGVDASRLTLVLPGPVTPDQEAAFDAMIAARAQFQPVAQIVGSRLFWGRSFRVTPDVLDPRPETETLVAAALDLPFADVLDLGTGSGAIVLTLLAERPAARAVAVDLSPAALNVARANAQALGVDARVSFVLSDWFAQVTGQFDLIVSNPPYIATCEVPTLAPEVRDWEPRMALVPALDDGTGLAAYRHICARAPYFLRMGGALMVEIGPTQGPDVAALFKAEGLQDISILPDMDGRARVVCGFMQKIR
jgi:release factor glutamine methyltransferase